MSSKRLSVSIDPQAEFANAITYRLERVAKSVESIIDEVISDIPHIRDFANSASEVTMYIASGNYNSAISALPKFTLSLFGTLAAIPNIFTINQERKEHKRELKSTLDMRQHFIDSRNTDVIEQEERLELEGIENTGVKILTDKEVDAARRVVDMNMFQRVRHNLRHPDKELLRKCTITPVHFVFKTTKDASLNFILPKSRNAIIEGSYYGIKNTFRSRVSERKRIDRLASLETLSEKIARAQQEEQDSVVIRGRYIQLARLDPDLVKKLDGIREATRDKAKQLKVASTGFGLQATFIVASGSLCLLHMSHQDWLEAATQYGSANLASNPLNFVGRQTEELYQAINSHRAEEAEELVNALEAEINLS